MTTAEIIAQLEQGLASSEAVIVIDNQRVEYRSVKEIEAALDYFKKKLAADTIPNAGRSHSTTAVYIS